MKLCIVQPYKTRHVRCCIIFLVTAILGIACEAIINYDGHFVPAIDLKMKSTLSILSLGILLSVVSAFSLDIRDQTCPGRSLPFSSPQKTNWTKILTSISCNRWGSLPQRRWQCLLQRRSGRGLHVLLRRLLPKRLLLLRRAILLHHESRRR